MVSSLLLALGLLLASRRASGMPAARPGPEAEAAAAVACTSQAINPILRSFPGAGVTLTLEGTPSSVRAGGSFYGEGSANKATQGYPAVNLPALCAVVVRVQNATDRPASDFRFGLFLPTGSGAWNGRFLAVGNGAFAGGINWPYMGEGPHYGFATMSTDTGHSSAASDLSWGLNSPANLLEWGHRAVRGSVAAAKHVTAGFYGGAVIQRSYFTGCSTGGRQALKAIQGDPDSFDGALIGAPAWDTKHLMPWGTKVGKDNVRADGSRIFDPAITAPNGGGINVLIEQVRQQCDSDVDGVADGIVTSPELCRLDYARFTCGPEVVDNCLTEEQVRVVRTMYSDYVLADGSFVHNGMELTSESEAGQWGVYLSNPAVNNVQYERNFLYNSTGWQLGSYSEQVVRDSRRVDPGQASADSFDLSRFRAHGGKVILYHGLSDGLVPTRSTTRYYNRTREVTGRGGEIDDFLRYFQVPGMGHCFFTPAGTDAPWMFSAVGQATSLAYRARNGPAEFTRAWGTPLFRSDPGYDALGRLMAWVENGTAPSLLKAASYDESTWRLSRTRKLCPFPRKGVFPDPSKNEDDEASWECR